MSSQPALFFPAPRHQLNIRAYTDLILLSPGLQSSFEPIRSRLFSHLNSLICASPYFDIGSSASSPKMAPITPRNPRPANKDNHALHPIDFSRTPPYLYSPIDPELNQIRLVTLYPGRWSEPIRCSLRTVSLSDKPKYQALSYAWGDWTNRKLIRVGGKNFWVTQNLWLGLRRLRIRWEPRTLWIDAICINQADDEEKTHQVSRMARIFEMCASGLVWLGEDPVAVEATRYPPPSRLARRAFEVFEMFCAAEHANQVQLTTKNGPDDFKISPSYAHHVESFSRLAAFPYWTRVWILQELAYPCAIDFIFASEKISVCKFETALGNWAHMLREPCCYRHIESLISDGLFSAMLSHIIQIISIVETRIIFQHQGKKGLSLLYLRQMHRRQKATDPRDLVYALLGLVGSETESTKQLKPDYSLAAHQVFQRATLHVLSSYKTLSVLFGERGSSRDHSIPSWVPDWVMLPPDSTQTVFISYNFSFYPYLASGNLKAWFSQPTENVILVDSKKVGCISSAFCEDFYDIWDWDLPLRPWMEFAGLTNLLITLEPELGSREDGFWRTINCDTYHLIDNPSESRRLGQFHPERHLHWWLKGWAEALRNDKAWTFWSGVENITLRNNVDGRGIFATESGALGTGSRRMQPGDEVHVLIGSSVPFILRPYQPSEEEAGCPSSNQIPSYTVIGECYLHGFMDGEALEDGGVEGIRTIALY